MTKSSQSNVDFDGLRSFMEMLAGNTEEALIPGVQAALSKIDQRTRFGASVPGGEIAARRQVFATALERVRANTERQVTAARILGEVIESVLANYTEAEKITADKLIGVEQSLVDTAADAARSVDTAPDQAGGRF